MGVAHMYVFFARQKSRSVYCIESLLILHVSVVSYLKQCNVSINIIDLNYTKQLHRHQGYFIKSAGDSGETRQDTMHHLLLPALYSIC